MVEIEEDGDDESRHEGACNVGTWYLAHILHTIPRPHGKLMIDDSQPNGKCQFPTWLHPFDICM